HQVSHAIADHALETHLHAQLIQALREVEGIRVLAVRREQLRADGDNLRVHASSVFGTVARTQSECRLLSDAEVRSEATSTHASDREAPQGRARRGRSRRTTPPPAPAALRGAIPAGRPRS